jgi:hypothetical protein
MTGGCETGVDGIRSVVRLLILMSGGLSWAGTVVVLHLAIMVAAAVRVSGSHGPHAMLHDLVHAGQCLLNLHTI